MTTEDTRNQKRKIEINLLSKIYEGDIPCLATIHTAEADQDWGKIYEALNQVELFINELKHAIR